MKSLMILLILILAGILGLLLVEREDAPRLDEEEMVSMVADEGGGTVELQVDDAPPASLAPPLERSPNVVGRPAVVPEAALRSARQKPAQPAEPVAPAMPVRILLGHDRTDPAVLDEDLTQAIDGEGWEDYRNLLRRSLVHAAKQLELDDRTDRFAPVWDEPTFYTMMLRWKMFEWFPPGLWQEAAVDSALNEMAGWLFRHDEAMEEVLLTIRPQDDAAAALLMLANLWGSHNEHPERAPKYFNLALACALVFDSKLAYRTPISHLDSEIDAYRRHAWYVKHNERGWLEVSIDRSSARDLCFVVCAPIREDEMDWAVREYRGSRRKAWGKTYGEIEYLMERAAEGLNPYEEYTLEEIQKEGGICGDQTYFCVNTARAAGIPAIGLSGVTHSGGHAWAAVKVDKDEWSTGIGRIGGVSMGRARDPQTGEKLTEQDFWMWSSRDYRSASRCLKVHRHLWLADLMQVAGLHERHDEAVRSAHFFGKAFPFVWERMSGVLERDPLFTSAPADSRTVGRWQAFCADIKREFRENPRMAGLAQTVQAKHVFPYLELGEARKLLARDRRRMTRSASEQTDLVTDSLKSEARLLMDKDPENALREISELYDSALKEYGGSTTGFQAMADDYFRWMKSEKDYAYKAVRDIELAFKRMVDTGSVDFFRAKVETGLHRRICNMYRQIGEEKRADLLERRLERQMEKAKRNAL